MAVMEGQATWLMSEFLARRMGETLVHNPELAEPHEPQLGFAGGGEFPVFDGSPLYLRATLVFPYTSGMLFPAGRGGQGRQRGVRRGLPPRRRFPRSRFCIPDKYFAGVKPVSPDLPKPAFHARLQRADRRHLRRTGSPGVAASSSRASRQPVRSRRTGAAGSMRSSRTKRRAARSCCTPRNGTTRDIGASVLPGISESAGRQVEEDGSARRDRRHGEGPGRRRRFRSSPGRLGYNQHGRPGALRSGTREGVFVPPAIHLERSSTGHRQ